MTTRHVCARCGYSGIHPTGAIGRFGPDARAYRADYPDSPLRPTRAEAEADMCNWRAEK